MPNTQFPTVVQLSSLNGLNGFKLDGSGGESLGASISGGGDINNDAVDDLIIGAPNVGRAYVVFGRLNIGSNGLFAVSSLNGTNGFRLDGDVSSIGFAQAVSVLGDINGDTMNDLLIGAWAADPGGRANAGQSYVVFGGPGIGGNGVFAVSTLNGTNGFKLEGEAASDESGRSVSKAGDINNDGVDDLIIGAPYDVGAVGVGGPGRTYAVFGSSGVGGSGTLALSSLNGVTGCKLDGEFNEDYSSYSVSEAGDINDDGIDDFVFAPVPSTLAFD